MTHAAADPRVRRAAFAAAYRMLGSVSEAEDVVQEALLRLHRAQEDGQEIASPRAYAVAVATRLAIDELRSARARREAYVGEWLPEPLVTGGDEDPAAAAETADALSLALLVVLETLTPEQRAAYVLREAFDYSYEEIGRMLGKRPDAVRQIATRARRHVADRRPRFPAPPERREELARRFFAAAQEGDLAGLERLLADDVVLRGDGGGRVPALARSIQGRDRVARTLLAWSRNAARADGVALEPAELNGHPGALLRDRHGRVLSALALDIADDGVRGIISLVNPDKLRHLGPVGDFRSILRGRTRPTPPPPGGGG
jgi:RNA polymerase sigma-70 factor (TIGR02957 family)